MRINFNEINEEVPESPGFYEIYRNDGLLLKVGIGINIKSRLCQHRASLQSGLILKPNGSWANPNDVVSKKSILAKHLYFDQTITNDYDLTTQTGRRNFLLNDCYILFEPTDTLEEAQNLEDAREAEGNVLYLGEVQIRQND
jgi:hypothetical protein